MTRERLISRVTLAVAAGVITQEQLSKEVNALVSIGEEVSYDQALQVHNNLLGPLPDEPPPPLPIPSGSC